MFTILHITDLHRTKSDPISNAELISALVSDREQYAHEDPPIADPQAIIVSGDIVQGTVLNSPNCAEELANQYEAAYDFLVDLTNRFLNGDRSKVLIIPGNHDIDWNAAFASMEVVKDEEFPKELLRALHEPDSPYRWDWKSRQLYIIRDRAAYDQRLAAFWRFFERFYSGIAGLLRVQAWSDANLYSLDEGRIGVAAFNSCVSNDCFSFHGEIPRSVIAQSHLDLRALGAWRLRIAVWHHDIEGPPNRSDYMDPEIVKGMIGRGFRLGLYGHQHQTQITPKHAYLPDRETMAVVSAGSLCAGSRELPTGTRRGYSIIEIGDDYDRARVHVREMAFANLFSRAHLAIFGGRSYVDLEWTTPVDAAGRPENPIRERKAAILFDAESALREDGDPREALRLLRTINASSDPYGRRLMVSAAQELGDPSEIIAVVGSPQTIEELVLSVDAHLNGSDHESAKTMLAEHGARLGLPKATASDLEHKIGLVRKTRS
ncbi:MAG: metallophosphoesterase family protein [Inquilinaceae bacterium]